VIDFGYSLALAKSNNDNFLQYFEDQGAWLGNKQEEVCALEGEIKKKTIKLFLLIR
jgi:hypothetical protein